MCHQEFFVGLTNQTYYPGARLLRADKWGLEDDNQE